MFNAGLLFVIILTVWWKSILPPPLIMSEFVYHVGNLKCLNVFTGHMTLHPSVSLKGNKEAKYPPSLPSGFYRSYQSNTIVIIIEHRYAKIL